MHFISALDKETILETPTLTGILRNDVSKMLSAFNFGEKANKVSGIFKSTKTPFPTVADFTSSKF